MNDSVGLPKYNLFIDRYDLFVLGNPLLLFEQPAQGQLKINELIYEINFNFRGHYTRNLPKRSYYIQLIKPNRYLGAREFHLNAEYNDPSFIRNKLSLDLFQLFEVLAPTSQHIQLYLNGTYEGVYLHIESVDDLFLQKRALPIGPIYYAINNNANFSLISPFTNDGKKSLLLGYESKFGSYTDNQYLFEFINSIHSATSSEFQVDISKHLAVEKYLRWLAVAVCTQNIDGFYHNYALYRNSETCLFEIMPWDYDSTFGRDWHGNNVDYNVLPIEGKNTLTKKLLEVPSFRKKYKMLLEELLDTFFTPHYLEPIIISLTDSIRPYLCLNTLQQLEQFEEEIDLIITFIKERNLYLRNNLHLLD